MTRAFFPHPLSALAALALVSALASSPPASAQMDSQINTMMNNNLMFNRGKPAPNGLTTQKPSAQPKGLSAQKPTTNRQFTRMIVKKLDGVRKAR
jgi:hypothetical protein